MPANAFAQGQLAAESRHKHRTPDWRPPLPQSMRKLLTPMLRGMNDGVELKIEFKNGK